MERPFAAEANMDSQSVKEKLLHFSGHRLQLPWLFVYGQDKVYERT
jgi:hypothetical protein